MASEKTSRVHPTQKPCKLFSDIVARMKKDDNYNLVLDLFGGSGSTLIACEQLNRKCYMMELDPHYCDVIIARWEKLTGQKATRL
jgi:DNA modification methylase